MMYWLISTTLATNTITPEWKMLELCQQDMTLCERVYTAEPRATRNPD